MSYIESSATNSLGNNQLPQFYGGDSVVKFKTKFYIEDDGGTWDELGGQPEYIWDFKRIGKSMIIDSGLATTHLNLRVVNGLESDDGVIVSSISSSKIEGLTNESPYTVSTNTFLILNTWFTLLEAPLYSNRQIMSILGNILLELYYVGNNWLLTLSINGTSYSSTWEFDSTQFDFTQNLTHALFLIEDKDSEYQITPIINGISYSPYTWSKIVDIELSSSINIGSSINAEFSYISISIKDKFNQDDLLNFHRFKYPLPRRPELVDLSDQVELYGKDLLLSANSIEKAIEALSGQLFMKTNSVKVKI